MAAIACEELSRAFGDVAAVRGVTFAIDEGEFFALLGPNGAGKSTMFHMLTTVLAPGGGRAEVAGNDIVRDARRVRDVIGVVFQERSLDDRLTARENLSVHAALYGIARAETGLAIAEALHWASLEEVADRRVRSYSGGMKRRLELARALMHEPHVLFLDEPTVGLDPQGRHHLWESIAQLRGRGLTVVMTTHNLAEADACDRIGLMDDGRLRVLETPERLRHTAGLPASAPLEHVFLALTGRALREERAHPKGRLRAFHRKGGERTR